MIFVTVGTHEQPFDRLVKYLDKLKYDGVIEDEIIIQTGFCTYEPHCCISKKMYSYSEMKKNMDRARIIITHGGPSSFLMSLQRGKIPIVVPRQKRFGEHINDHQMDFCKMVMKENKNIIVVENIKDIKKIILDYDNITRKMSVGTKKNNSIFNEKFNILIGNMFKGD